MDGILLKYNVIKNIRGIQYINSIYKNRIIYKYQYHILEIHFNKYLK